MRTHCLGAGNPVAACALLWLRPWAAFLLEMAGPSGWPGSLEELCHPHSSTCTPPRGGRDCAAWTCHASSWPEPRGRGSVVPLVHLQENMHLVRVRVTPRGYSSNNASIRSCNLVQTPTFAHRSVLKETQQLDACCKAEQRICPIKYSALKYLPCP